MEYIYAAMLLHKAGKEINEANLTQVLTAAGINADTVRVKALVASLAEVKIDEAIKSATNNDGRTSSSPSSTSSRSQTKRRKEGKEGRRETERRSSTRRSGRIIRLRPSFTQFFDLH